MEQYKERTAAESTSEDKLVGLAIEHGILGLGSGSLGRPLTVSEGLTIVRTYSPLVKACSLPEELYCLLE